MLNSKELEEEVEKKNESHGGEARKHIEVRREWREERITQTEARGEYYENEDKLVRCWIKLSFVRSK